MIAYRGSDQSDLIDAVQNGVEANYRGEANSRGYTRRRLKRLAQSRKAAQAILDWHANEYVPVYGAMYVPDDEKTEQKMRSAVLAAFGLPWFLSWLLPAIASVVIELLKKYLSSAESVVYRYSFYDSYRGRK